MWDMCMCIVGVKERDERAQQLGRRDARRLDSARTNAASSIEVRARMMELRM
jgi:hypothetical protein